MSVEIDRIGFTNKITFYTKPIDKLSKEDFNRIMHERRRLEEINRHNAQNDVAQPVVGSTGYGSQMGIAPGLNSNIPPTPFDGQGAQNISSGDMAFKANTETMY